MTTIDLIALGLAVVVVTLGIASIWVEPLRRTWKALGGVTLALLAYILGRTQQKGDEPPEEPTDDPTDPIPADLTPDSDRRRVDVDRARSDDVAVDFEGGPSGRIERLERLRDD